MIVALVDNGSIEPAAHRNLRTVAGALAQRCGVQIHAVSWRHSDRIPASALDGTAGLTLEPWLRSQIAAGERSFVFVPFFVSPQGAIGSALRRDLEQLQNTVEGFKFVFCAGLATRAAIAGIVAARIRETIAAVGLKTPPVVVVDHGGPSPASAKLRNELAAEIRTELGPEVGLVVAASMEGAAHPHNQPLLSAQLATPGFSSGDVVIAPLFLSPGRHAGPAGDLAEIAQVAGQTGVPQKPPQRCHFTGLIGNHPQAIEVLATSLRETLAARPNE